MLSISALDTKAKEFPVYIDADLLRTFHPWKLRCCAFLDDVIILFVIIFFGGAMLFVFFG